MFLVGTCYNFCWVHKSLRRERTEGDQLGRKWVESTRRRRRSSRVTVGRSRSLSFCTPPAEIPKRRGRRPKWLVEAPRAT